MTPPNTAPEPSFTPSGWRFGLWFTDSSRGLGSAFDQAIIMKIAFCLLVVSIAICALASDADIHKNLLGVWRVVQSPPQDRSIVSLFTFTSSTGFTNRIIFPGVAREIDMTGTFRIQDGYLILTVTNSSQKTVQRLPFVLRSKIIQAYSSQFVTVADGATNKQTFKKETR